MVGKRPTPIGCALVLAALTGGCGSDPKTDSTDAPVARQCPELSEAQLAEAVALQNQGVQLYMNRGTKEAIEALEKAREMNPCDPSIYNDLGIAYHQNHEIKKATATLQEGIALDPLYPQTHLNLGAVYDDFANFEDAAKEYEEFLRLYGTFGDAHSRLGMVYLKVNRFADARTQLELASVAKPEDWEIWYNLGNIAFREGDFALAEQHYRKTLEVNSAYTEAHYKLGQALTRLGREEEAQVHFDEFKGLSRYQERIDELNRLLRQNSDRADAVYMMLGFQYTEMERYEEAIEHFERSLSIKADVPEVLVGMSHAKRKLKKFTEAMGAAEKALSIQPDMLQALDAKSNVLFDDGHPEEALAVVRHLRKAHPDYVGGPMNEALILRHLKDYRGAIDALREFLAKRPDDLRGHEALLDIYTYAKDSRYHDQVRAMEAARTCEKLGSQRFDLIAEAYHMNGDLEAAKTWLERAIASTEDTSERASHERHLREVQQERGW